MPRFVAPNGRVVEIPYDAAEYMQGQGMTLPEPTPEPEVPQAAVPVPTEQAGLGPAPEAPGALPGFETQAAMPGYIPEVPGVTAPLPPEEQPIPEMPLELVGAKPEDKAVVADMMALQGLKDEREDAQAHHAKMAALREQEAQHMRDTATEQAVRQKTQEAALGAEMEALQTERQALLQAEPDPARYFANASTVSKIGMLIGVIGKSSAYGDGRNQALAMIERAVDRDIQSQVTALQSRHRALGHGMNLYEKMLAKYKDSNVAWGQTRATTLAAIGRKLLAEGERYKGTVAGNYKSAASEILLGSADRDELMANNKLNRDMKRDASARGWAQIRATRRGQDQAQFRWEETMRLKAEEEEAKKNAPKPIPGDQALVPRGVYVNRGKGGTAVSQRDPFVANSPEERKEVGKKIKLSNQILDRLHRIEKIGVSRALPAKGSDRGQELETQFSDIMRIIIEQGPRISDIDLEWYKKSSGAHLTDFFRYGDEAQRKKILQQIKRNFREDAEDAVSQVYTGTGASYEYRYEPPEDIKTWQAEKDAADAEARKQKLMAKVEKSTGMSEDEFFREYYNSPDGEASGASVTEFFHRKRGLFEDEKFKEDQRYLGGVDQIYGDVARRD